MRAVDKIKHILMLNLRYR